MILEKLFEFLPKSKRSASYGLSYGKYPFFTSSNVINSYVDEPDYNGEYLIIGDGGSGNCKYFNGEFSVSDHNYILKPKENCNSRCVRYFLKKDDFKILNDGFHGAGIKNISKTYIKNIDYKYNRKYTEKIIVESLSNIENMLSLKINTLNSLNELIKSRFIVQEVAI